MADTLDPNPRRQDRGGGRVIGAEAPGRDQTGEDMETAADALEPEHDQPVEGGLEEAEDSAGRQPQA